MTDRDIDRFSARAEFYLCLSRAFLTPAGDAAYAGMREALADDLAELDRVLAYGAAEAVAAYRDAIARVPGALELLQIYSALFLAPPRTAQINIGSYLDGSINGGSVLAMEHDYRRHGLARQADFHDLSDHIAIQLEFVAMLFMPQAADGDAPVSDAAMSDAEDDARVFLGTYVRRWLPPFIRDLEHETLRLSLVANPYLHLARLLQTAVRTDARAPQAAPAELRARNAITKARHDRAVRGVSAADIEIIARKLREKGLSTEHLAIAPEQRDAARGLTKRTLPSPRRGSRLG